MLLPRNVLAMVCVVFTLTGCSYLNVRSIRAVNAHDTPTFDGLKVLLVGDASLVEVLVVHGFGTHNSGYSAALQARLVAELGLTDPSCGADLPMQGGQYGSMRVCQYTAPGPRTLRVYELLWSPLTSPLKARYLGQDERAHHRLLVDKALKHGLMNDRFSDAVLYLGDFKSRMQLPIEWSLCFMLNDPLTEQALRSAVDPSTACATYLTNRVTRSPRARALAIVTESLGSTMVWQTLVQMHEDGDRPESPFKSVAEEVLGHTRIVFLLANQLALLSLGEVTDPLPLPGQSSLVPRTHSVFPRKLDAVLREAKTKTATADRPITVVAVTDSNDLLGYGIPGKLVTPTERQYLRVVNVTKSVAHLGWGFVLVNPLKAHTKYYDDSDVLGMIVCGSASCADSGR